MIYNVYMHTPIYVTAIAKTPVELFVTNLFDKMVGAHYVRDKKETDVLRNNQWLTGSARFIGLGLLGSVLLVSYVHKSDPQTIFFFFTKVVHKLHKL